MIGTRSIEDQLALKVASGAQQIELSATNRQRIRLIKLSLDKVNQSVMEEHKQTADDRADSMEDLVVSKWQDVFSS